MISKYLQVISFSLNHNLMGSLFNQWDCLLLYWILWYKSYLIYLAIIWQRWLVKCLEKIIYHFSSTPQIDTLVNHHLIYINITLPLPYSKSIPKLQHIIEYLSIIILIFLCLIGLTSINICWSNIILDNKL